MLESDRPRPQVAVEDVQGQRVSETAAAGSRSYPQSGQLTSWPGQPVDDGEAHRGRLPGLGVRAPRQVGGVIVTGTAGEVLSLVAAIGVGQGGDGEGEVVAEALPQPRQYLPLTAVDGTDVDRGHLDSLPVAPRCIFRARAAP